MKRMAVVALGFVWGLLVTWVAVYVLNRIHWPEVKSHATSCNDMEHCTSHVKFLWGIAFFALTLCAVLFYGKPYVAPYIGLAS